MSYTRNFGMRSFENIVRVGRLKTPSTGSALNIGASVTADEANAGLLKVAAADSLPGPLSGALVYEHIQYQGVDQNLTTESDAPFNVVPLGRYAQVIHGVGTKVWMKNTGTVTLYDGRTRAALTIVTLTGVAVGDYLTPNGTGGWKKATLTGMGAVPGSGWLQVESVNTTAGTVEARFAF